MRQGEVTSVELTITFSAFLSKMSFITLHIRPELFLDELQDFLHQVLLDHLEDLVLRQVFTVHDTLDNLRYSGIRSLQLSIKKYPLMYILM